MIFCINCLKSYQKIPFWSLYLRVSVFLSDRWCSLRVAVSCKFSPAMTLMTHNQRSTEGQTYCHEPHNNWPVHDYPNTNQKNVLWMMIWYCIIMYYLCFIAVLLLSNLLYWLFTSLFCLWLVKKISKWPLPVLATATKSCPCWQIGHACACRTFEERTENERKLGAVKTKTIKYWLSKVG